MIYRFQNELIKELLHLPETGMGYQIIEAELPVGNYLNAKRFIVYNAELAVDMDEGFEINKRRIYDTGYRKMFAQSEPIFLGFNRVLGRAEVEQPSFRSFFKAESSNNDKGRHTNGSAAADNKPRKANGKDVFVRLSAYENDRRVDTDNKCLLPGSYTTTEDDYVTCKDSNDDPIDRYALPNDEEIKWAFHIQPTSFDEYRYGIVQPANGHQGGGVEALFDNGTSENTFIFKGDY